MIKRISIPIEDPDYLKLLKDIELNLDQIMFTSEYALIRYARYVETLPIEYYRAPIVLIWREAIEFVDAIKSLISSSSCNCISVFLRSLFELYLGVSFIFSDETKIKQRALAYDGIRIIRKIEDYKKFDPNSSDYRAFKECLGSDFFSESDKDFDYQSAINNLNSVFVEKEEYKEFKHEYDYILKQKKKHGRGVEQQIHIQWYELFGGKSSIFKLADMMGMKKFYITLYDQFSLKGHGNDAMSSLKKSTLKNPKIPDLKSLASDIDLTLTFISGIT